ncbi:MAG TPA: hypothetical protein VFZ66_09565 [Herpetosiphonaceae bacterium]
MGLSAHLKGSTQQGQSRAWSTLDRLDQVTDAHGNVTGMTYVSLGRTLTMSDPDMRNTTPSPWRYTYDMAGQRYNWGCRPTHRRNSQRTGRYRSDHYLIVHRTGNPSLWMWMQAATPVAVAASHVRPGSFSPVAVHHSSATVGDRPPIPDAIQKAI